MELTSIRWRIKLKSMKYNIRKYILAGITAILAAAVLTACGGSKPSLPMKEMQSVNLF